MVKRMIEITIIEILVAIIAGIDVLIRLNDFIAKQEPKPTTIEYFLVNGAFFIIIVIIIIAYRVYNNPKEIENKGGLK